jgi:lactobin A/cerein 7B family class IIb bacteriocin
MEFEMHKLETTADIRPLTDAELDEVNGGIAPLVAAFFVGAMTGVTIGAFIHGSEQTGTLRGLRQ